MVRKYKRQQVIKEALGREDSVVFNTIKNAKAVDKVTVDFIVDSTGIPRDNVSKSLEYLEQRNLVSYKRGEYDLALALF